MVSSADLKSRAKAFLAEPVEGLGPLDAVIPPPHVPYSPPPAPPKKAAEAPIPEDPKEEARMPQPLMPQEEETRDALFAAINKLRVRTSRAPFPDIDAFERDTAAAWHKGGEHRIADYATALSLARGGGIKPDSRDIELITDYFVHRFGESDSRKDKVTKPAATKTAKKAAAPAPQRVPEEPSRPQILEEHESLLGMRGNLTEPTRQDVLAQALAIANSVTPLGDELCSVTFPASLATLSYLGDPIPREQLVAVYTTLHAVRDRLPAEQSGWSAVISSAIADPPAGTLQGLAQLQGEKRPLKLPDRAGAAAWSGDTHHGLRTPATKRTTPTRPHVPGVTRPDSGTGRGGIG